MRKMQICVVFWAMMVFMVSGASFTSGSDHHYHHHKGHHESSKPEVAQPVLITNQTYEDQCGACHFAYQPFLLPSGSWKKILSALDNHFDQAVELDPESKQIIADYLDNGASEKSSKKLGRKIMKSLGNITPLRITDTPYIQRKHHEISSKTLARESIGSLANCSACHQTAEKGSYNEDSVKMPK